MATFEATVTSKGQVTLPARLRSTLKLKPGDKLVFVQEDDGGVRVQAKTHTLADLRGFIKTPGTPVSGDQIAAWIEESRGARWRRHDTPATTARPRRK